MGQSFKSVYFPDYPANPSAQRHIRIAFGDKETDLFNNIRHLSSEEIRQLLKVNTYEELQEYANNNLVSINRACISLLHKKTSSIRLGKTRYSLPSLLSDPLIATYRGGDRELLHSWFPIIEGFSPDFVKSVLETYAPNALKILDPFAGVGTTPITILAVGAIAYYCELNPLLQLITEVKCRAYQLDKKQRNDIITRLTDLAFQLSFRLGMEKADEGLRKSYIDTFGKSRFFDDPTFEDVLKLRTMVDTLSDEAPLLGQLFTVAVLSSLVPSSLMLRRGDLRYKTAKELERITHSLCSEISRKLEMMAEDIGKLEQTSGKAVLVSEDALLLKNNPILNIDCIITSPPYLNGTNYFRNTKIELWFLRILKKSGDLGLWRSKSITAGINDVTKDKCDKPYPPEINATIEAIREVAYDKRITQMISSYFREFDLLFQSFSRHLNNSARVIIDIGDSRYGGVHVATDELLSMIASKHGLYEIEKNTLRLRKSRDGGILRQSLLVLEYKKHNLRSITKVPTLNKISSQNWAGFKSDLPYKNTPYSKRNWGHPLHSLCSYQGKMKPSLAHFLVETFVPKKGRILDPFAGVGTIPFEACLNGKEAFGFEISPSAFSISAAKVTKPNRGKVYSIIRDIEDYVKTGRLTTKEIANAKRINFNHSLNEFYSKETFQEILLARRYFQNQQQSSPELQFALACMLHILHGNRPYALSRRSHPVTPFVPKGPFEYKSLVKSLLKKAERSLDVEYPELFHAGKIYLQDAISWWPIEITDLDAIITSPPFYDSTRFYLANWIRLWFCGWEREDFNTKPLRFLELKQKQTLRVYESVFRQARERLKPRGVFVMHLGKSNKCDMAKELSDIARPWFNITDVFEEDVSKLESHGITDKGRVSIHQYLILG